MAPSPANMGDSYNMANNNSFTLTDNRNGRSWELPVMKGSTGPDVVDVRKFYADTDCFTYDRVSHQLVAVNRKSPLSMAIKAFFGTVVTRSKS